MNLIRRTWGHARVLRKARRNRGDLPRWLARRPQLALGTLAFETALLGSGRADSRLKQLVSTKTAMLVACEFCLDIGSELARQEGIDEETLQALVHYRDSDRFTEVEKLCLQLAEEVTRTPAQPSSELREQLLRHLSPAQLVEVVAEITWENQRARLNQALGIRPAGFSDGAFCVRPDPVATDQATGAGPGPAALRPVAP